MPGQKNNHPPVKSPQTGTLDQIFTTFRSGVQIIEGLVKSYSSICGTLNTKSTATTDNAIKIGKMETERKKVENELEKLRAEAHDREQNREIIKMMVEMLKDQQKKLLEMDDFYKTPEATTRLTELNRIILQLVKELKN